jgi:hypothetical protein
MHCQVAAGGADPTAAPKCANRHATIIAGAAIPNVKSSGLRRWLTATFREGVGSTPKVVICCYVADVESRNLDWECHSSATSRSPSPVRPRHLPMVCLIIKAPLSLYSRGASGWCLDVTSGHGAWRHAEGRFLLPGDRSSGMYYIQPEVKRSEVSARRGA